MKITGINRPKSLTDEAYQRLRAAVSNGSLELQRFYPLGEVAAGFGISRTPVREAVLKLAHEGLLEIRPRGFRLRHISLTEAVEIFELRSLLEGRTAEKVAAKCNLGEVQQLRSIIKRQQRLVNDPGRFLKADEQFHMTLLDLAGFRRAREFIAMLRDVIWSLGFEALSSPGRLDAVIVEHSHIVECIEQRSPAAAHAAINAHLESSYAQIRLNQRSGARNSSSNGADANPFCPDREERGRGADLRPRLGRTCDGNDTGT
jgi:DNA-binding GntR family transcriptional regulator